MITAPLRQAATDVRTNEYIEESPHHTAWLAVADWLDAIADHYEPIWQGPYVPEELASALAVAHAYLGEDAV